MISENAIGLIIGIFASLIGHYCIQLSFTFPGEIGKYIGLNLCFGFLLVICTAVISSAVNERFIAGADTPVLIGSGGVIAGFVNNHAFGAIFGLQFGFSLPFNRPTIATRYFSLSAFVARRNSRTHFVITRHKGLCLRQRTETRTWAIYEFLWSMLDVSTIYNFNLIRYDLLFVYGQMTHVCES